MKNVKNYGINYWKGEFLAGLLALSLLAYEIPMC